MAQTGEEPHKFVLSVALCYQVTKSLSRCLPSGHRTATPNVRRFCYAKRKANQPAIKIHMSVSSITLNYQYQVPILNIKLLSIFF